MSSKLAFFMLLLAVFCPRISYAQEIRTARVCIKGSCINAEIADTDQTRAKGLMYRASLAETEGMLFIFTQPGRYSFWMMNMRIALDLIWIDETRRIVDIKAGFEPCGTVSCESVTPQSDALYVLEVPSGFTLRHQAAIGDIITIDK